MLPISICGIICGPSNCGKTNVLISLLKNPHDIHFDIICVLEVVAIAKILKLEEFISTD